MKTLRESLIVTDAKIVDFTRTPTKDGATCVLHIKAPLNPDLADTLRCRNQIYTINDNPYPALKSFGLDHEISSCELSVTGQPLLQPSIVTGFSIRPSGLADAEGELEVSFRLKFSGNRKELWALLERVENNQFDLSLIALQSSLFDMPSQSDGPEGGTPVDMTELPPQKTDCVSCANNLAFTDEKQTKHLNGVKCTRPGLTRRRAAATTM